MHVADFITVAPSDTLDCLVEPPNIPLNESQLDFFLLVKMENAKCTVCLPWLYHAAAESHILKFEKIKNVHSHELEIMFVMPFYSVTSSALYQSHIIILSKNKSPFVSITTHN